MALYKETKERTTKALTELEEVVCLSLYSSLYSGQYMSPPSNAITTLDICTGLGLTDICESLGLTTTAVIAIIKIILDKLESEGRIIRKLDNSEDSWELPTDHLTYIGTLLEQYGYIWHCGEFITKEEEQELWEVYSLQEEMNGDIYSEEARQAALEAEYWSYCTQCMICGHYHLENEWC